MPFCTSCGNQLGDTDRFCGSCGAQQAVPKSDPLKSITPRTAAILCYVPVVGWIMSVVVLASPQYTQDRTLRFHAFQGIYLFVAWLLIQWVLEPIASWNSEIGGRMLRFSVHVLELAVFGGWVWMLVKTSQEQFYSLPFIGELAERSVAEQR